jgi:peptidylprolyl isomerase
MYDRSIMKLTSALILLAAAAPLAAQTITPKKSTGSATAKTTRPIAARSASACARLPELSPKIPALAANLPCAKHLYTLTIPAPGAVSDLAPFEDASALKDYLGIAPNSFSLDYIDIKPGTGQLAGAKSFYTIDYSGYLVDGTKFDSSVDRGEPLTVGYGQHQVIAGWDTGFAGMRVGGRRRLFIPYQLAYGPQGKGPIPAKAMLIFDVELKGISDTPPKPKTPPTPTPAPKPAAPATAPKPDATKPDASKPDATKPADAAKPAPPASPKP